MYSNKNKSYSALSSGKRNSVGRKVKRHGSAEWRDACQNVKTLLVNESSSISEIVDVIKNCDEFCLAVIGLANTEQKECNEPVVEIEHAIMVVGVNKLLDFISLRNEVNVMEMKQFTKHENKYVRAQMSS